MPRTDSQPTDVPLARLAEPRAITLRSLTIGTIAAVAVCSLTPLNDFIYAPSSLSLVVGYLPLAAVLIQFLLIVAINAPLHRWAPAYALRSGELAVVLLMVLVACSIPNWGLMRFFIPTPVAPFHLGAQDGQFWNAFVGMDLPGWLYPVDSVREGRYDDKATWFYNRVPYGQTIPFAAWIVPLLTWGIFIAAMLATLAAIARMVLEQWATNERLPFPLVQVQAALIEAPRPGRALNELFRSPWLWIAVGSVVFIHSLTTLNLYYPRYFPKIPLSYDFTGFIAEKPTPGEPLSFLDLKVKRAAISFIVVGVTYFIRSKVAMSMWGVYLLINLFNVQYGMRGGVEMPSQAYQDQHLGACIAFVGGILWIGRHHWIRILKNAVGMGTDSNYRVAFWIAVGGVIVMISWLTVLGVKVWLAVLIVLFIVLAHLIVSRVLAETGLPFYRSGIAVAQVYTNCPTSLFTMRDIYFSQVFTVLGPLTTRDGLMGFAMTGLGITKSAEVPPREQRRLGWPIGTTLLLGCIVAAFVTLYCQYSYPTPPTDNTVPPRNWFGAEYIFPRDVAPSMRLFNDKPPRFITKSHDPWLHMGIGFSLTAALEFASLRWASWPLLPVGYVTAYGAFIGNAWFSVFLGWLLKVVIVRFGGASLFQKARPFFVGIIFGEALAAGIWLVINVLVVMGGGEIRKIQILL
jgi:hypothetical protein